MKILEILEKIANQNIIVIGDVMIDAYLWGNVNRISPEAPVPIVSVTKRESRLGGAANVALNLKSLGLKPIVCSVIGEDDGGELFMNLMQENSLLQEGVLQTKTRKTTKKTRVISSGQQLLRVDDEISYSLTADIEKQFIDRVVQIIRETKITAIIFEDYDKGVISENVIQQITQIALEQSIPTTVDPKKENYNFYRDITLFKPNFKEFREGAKLDILKADTQAIFENAKKIISEKNIKYVFVTLSELGVFITDGKSYYQIPAEFRQIRDVSGAGDTVISVATLLLSLNVDIKTIASVSNIAGGLVCEKVGVVPITKIDLENAFTV